MTKQERLQFDLQYDDFSFYLWRVTEDEYRLIRENSVPIKVDGMFWIRLFLSERDNPNRLTLSKAFITLEYLLGKSSDWFDDWKSSFSFPTLLRLKRDAKQFFYLLRLEDYRGSLEFRLYRVLLDGVENYDVQIYQKPFEEFSSADINLFFARLYYYLAEVAKLTSQSHQQPFMKVIRSSHALYGYKNGAFFEDEIDDEEEFNAAIATFEAIYGATTKEEKRSSLQSLLQEISRLN